MQWASAITTQSDPAAALTELKRAISEQLGGPRTDLVCAFVSPQYGDSFAHISELVRAHFAPRPWFRTSPRGEKKGHAKVVVLETTTPESGHFP